MAASFVSFSAEHAVATALTLALAVLLPLAVRRSGSERWARSLRNALMVCLAAYLVLALPIRALGFGLPWQQHLPLHLCGASAVLGLVMLWRRSYRIYQVVYYWGTGGVLAALATPDLVLGFPHPLFLLFFAGHGLAFMAPMFATLVWGFVPSARSIVVALAAAAAYALAVYPVNLLLGANYLYLLHKPAQPSPLDLMGPWPWYIVGLCVVTVVIVCVCHLPFVLIRRTRHAAAVVLVALLLPAGLPAQPAADAGLLNSERIERMFGSYGIDVVEQDATVRVSNLYSGDDADRTTRTWAIVIYPQRLPAALEAPHAEIVAGGSIGAVLAARGWQVVKRHRFFGLTASTSRLQQLMDEPDGTELATHVYRLDAVRDGTAYAYAVIVEIHDPDYLTLADLRAIYGADYAPPLRRDELAGLLEVLDLAADRTR